MDISNVKKQAELEFKEELFREQVEEYKEKLRNKRSLLDKIFPYRILIVRTKNGIV